MDYSFSPTDLDLKSDFHTVRMTHRSPITIYFNVSLYLSLTLSDLITSLCFILQTWCIVSVKSLGKQLAYQRRIMIYRLSL